MEERKNNCIKICSDWNGFLAKLDVRIILCGYAEDISSWPLYDNFCGAPFYRLYLPLKGAFRIFSLENSITIRPDSFYLIPDTVPLKFLGMEQSSHYWIHFVSKQLHKLPFYDPLEMPKDSIPDVRNRIERILAMCREADRSIASLLEAKCELERLLIPFLEKLALSGPDPAQPRKQLFELVDYIDLNLERRLTVAELAKQANLNSAMLTSLFVGHFGIPPKQYITTRRLYQAKLLLLQSNLPIKEIAWRCGWKDEYFFFRIFRKHVGITPNSYRRYQVY